MYRYQPLHNRLDDNAFLSATEAHSTFSLACFNSMSGSGVPLPCLPSDRGAANEFDEPYQLKRTFITDMTPSRQCTAHYAAAGPGRTVGTANTPASASGQTAAPDHQTPAANSHTRTVQLAHHGTAARRDGAAAAAAAAGRPVSCPVGRK